MVDRAAQKPGAIKPSTLLRTKSGKDNPTVGLAEKLFAVQTQAAKEYGVYNSDDYAGWRKKNGFSNIDPVAIGKKAKALEKALEQSNVSMADIKAANAFLKKYHSPLVGLDKREARLFNQEMGIAKRKMPFHRKSSLIKVAGDSARAIRKKEDS